LEEEDPAVADQEDTVEVLTQEMHHVDLRRKRRHRKLINDTKYKTSYTTNKMLSVTSQWIITMNLQSLENDYYDSL
jgi:hypothetical protein